MDRTRLERICTAVFVSVIVVAMVGLFLMLVVYIDKQDNEDRQDRFERHSARHFEAIEECEAIDGTVTLDFNGWFRACTYTPKEG